MNNKLITALKTAANALEQETFYYDWRRPSNCNCGVLFCALTGVSSSQLLQRMPRPLIGSFSNWTVLLGQYCPVTGIPEHELFKELFAYGLTPIDIVHLEGLSDPEVVKRMKVRIPAPPKPAERTLWQKFWNPPPRWDDEDEKVGWHDEKRNVVSYMRAWAELLEERGKLDQVPAEQKAEEVVHEN